ncbi:MAG: YjbH domain-containing protein [Reyranella sp.]|nr:YjbH domain-containing protein [Reyranella sp.]
MRPLLCWSGSVAFLAALSCPAQADDYFYNARTTYGEVGLLEMPSAHVAPDGEIGLTIAAMQGSGSSQRYIGTFQVLPWVEASFRYSRIKGLFQVHDYWDRSFGVKFRLGRESEDWPEISLGLRDFFGTGIYSGEYLVASKHFGDFDATMGVGWGRFAESNALPNPIASIFPSFKTRSGTSTAAGTFDFGTYFHGKKIGVFGGIVWRTPIEDLHVILEYSSDRYSLENQFRSMRVRNPIDVGLSYRAFDTFTFSAGWFYGTTYGATITFAADPTAPLSPLRFASELPLPTVRPSHDQILSLEALLGSRYQAANHLGERSAPWVNLAVAETPQQLELLSALMAEGVGVRNAEADGRTLIVDAGLSRSVDSQCESYARIAANFDTVASVVALSDLSGGSGRVVFCTIARDAATRARPDGPAPASVALPSPEQVNRKIVSDLDEQSIRTEAVSATGGTLWLYFSNHSYASEAEAAGRIARILMSDAPPTVEVFYLVSVKHGLAMRQFTIARSALERTATVSGSAMELANAVALMPPPLSNPMLQNAFDESYPRLHWSIAPSLREGLFDPDRPLAIQAYTILSGSVELTPNIELSGSAEASLIDNFNTKRLSDSKLPHVRSDSVLYFRDGKNGVADLMATYRDRLTDDAYFEVRVGYLESMFGGIGAQVLWRPDGERFAIGADLYKVWQRDFNRLFGFQKYHVLTGHVTVYYASPWYGLNFNVHAGRYLAGDYGATFEITRRFSTGVEIGVYATFTNVPFSKFGEGSFDKGILLRIPLEWALPIFSQSNIDMRIQSLTRDGGARLEDDDSLYDETYSTSYGAIESNAESVVAP